MDEIRRERELMVKYLNLMGDEYANHGCNDLDKDIFNSWTVSEKKEYLKKFNEWNCTPDIMNLEDVPDYGLIKFLAFRLKHQLTETEEGWEDFMGFCNDWEEMPLIELADKIFTHYKLIKREQ